jgi:hypothetical protein
MWVWMARAASEKTSSGIGRLSVLGLPRQAHRPCRVTNAWLDASQEHAPLPSRIDEDDQDLPVQPSSLAQADNGRAAVLICEQPGQRVPQRFVRNLVPLADGLKRFVAVVPVPMTVDAAGGSGPVRLAPGRAQAPPAPPPPAAPPRWATPCPRPASSDAWATHLWRRRVRTGCRAQGVTAADASGTPGPTDNPAFGEPVERRENARNNERFMSSGEGSGQRADLHLIPPHARAANRRAAGLKAAVVASSRSSIALRSLSLGRYGSGTPVTSRDGR